MKRCSFIIGAIIGLTNVSALSAGSAEPLDPAGFAQLVDSGIRPFVVDVRTADQYRAGSLPGAVHIPAAFMQRRQFPQLPAMVIVDDGLGGVNGRAVAEGMSERFDFPVFWLRGGYAAWLEAGGSSTASGGLQPEVLPRLTYRQLTEADLGDAVLFDLRGEAGDLAPASADDPVSGFARQLGVPVSRINPVEAFERPVQPEAGQMAPASTKPLIVLIDDNDGTAEEVARKLRANGHHRVVILTGGAEIIRHQGRSGKLRRSTGIELEVSADELP